jgi:hypothetical protein
MLTVLWYSQGPVLEHYQEKGTTINSAWYSEMLTDRLKPAAQSKHQGLLLKCVVLLHDNSRPHTAAYTAETVWKLESDAMAHCIVPISPFLSLLWSTQRNIKGPHSPRTDM